MLFVHGMGHFHPENEIDNAFLESLDIGTTDQWIMERVGIKTRRTVLPLSYIADTKNADSRLADTEAIYTNAETAEKAARMALTRAGISPEDVGMVVAGGCSPQYTTPAESCTIASQLGIEAPSFDVNSACSTFAVQLHFLNQFQPEALPDYVLVVNPENNTRAIDYQDRSTAVLWGDATTAAVLSPRRTSRLKITSSIMGSNPSNWNKVLIPPGEHFEQDGRAVQTFAVKRTLKMLAELKERAGKKGEDLFFIGHQANLRMLQSVCDRGEIASDRHWFNVDGFGNCGAAGAPSVLSQHWDDLTKGQSIAMAIVGAGLSWGGLLFEQS